MTDPRDDTSNDVHALSGAYVVDALDPHERARFEEHLRACSACTAEVESLREATAGLAVDAETAPPPALRANVLAGVEHVRPLPPVTNPEQPAPATAPRPLRRFFGLTGPQLVLAAAVVAVLAVAGTAWWQPWAHEEPTLDATERVLTDPDAFRATERLPGGASALIVVSRTEGRAVVVTDDLAPAPEGKVYELWLQTPAGELEPAGLVPDEPDTTVMLDGDATNATAVGITVEPDGGSQQPTTDPIAFVEVEQ